MRYPECTLNPAAAPLSRLQCANALREVKQGLKLTEKDRRFLRTQYHEDDESIDQIERALRKTTFYLGNKRISAEEVVERIGWEMFLSGLDRSAFHVTAVRRTPDGEEIFFNSRRFFRESERSDVRYCKVFPQKHDAPPDGADDL